MRRITYALHAYKEREGRLRFERIEGLNKRQAQAVFDVLLGTDTPFVAIYRLNPNEDAFEGYVRCVRAAERGVETEVK